MKYYFAYGSNLNIRQMSLRCPTAWPVGTAILKGWRLVYKGSLTGAYLTIERCRNSYVPLGVWAVSDSDERALDRYEGYPRFYFKKAFQLPVIGMDGEDLGKKTGLIYIMNPQRTYALPSMPYIRTCQEGYKDFGFKRKILDEALLATRRKMK